MDFTEEQIRQAEQEALSSPSRPSKNRRKKNGQPRRNNKSGLVGAFQAGGYGKWISRIRINGKVIQVKNNEGKTYFHSAEEAHQAYISAAKEHGIIIP